MSIALIENGNAQRSTPLHRAVFHRFHQVSENRILGDLALMKSRASRQPTTPQIADVIPFVDLQYRMGQPAQRLGPSRPANDESEGRERGARHAIRMTGPLVGREWLDYRRKQIGNRIAATSGFRHCPERHVGIDAVQPRDNSPPPATATR